MFETITKKAAERELRLLDGKPPCRDLEPWRSYCETVVNGEIVDDGQPETMEEAIRWDADKARYVKQGMADKDAARAAWDIQKKRRRL